MLSVKQESIKYHFESLVLNPGILSLDILSLGIEPGSPGPLANTLPTVQWSD